MLERELADHFQKNEFMWKMKDDKYIIPSEKDIEQALDKAAALLYDSPIGSQIEVGRLIVKKISGERYDVYAHFGSYT